MRRGRADRLRQEDRRRFEELFLPYLDAAYNLARWILQHDQDAKMLFRTRTYEPLKDFTVFAAGTQEPGS